MMRSIRLICWHAPRTEECAAWLRSHGYEVHAGPISPAGLRALRDNPPEAVIIDLNRMPSHGRDVAVALRKYKDTRCVPLIFAGGDPQKTERIKKLLPDAVYTTWDNIIDDLEYAIAHAPEDPVVPQSAMAGYSGRPLPKKLGIKAGSTVALAGAPEDFDETLGEVPEDVILRSEDGALRDLTLWFVRSREELEQGTEKMAELAGDALWIMWPKKASGLHTDLSQNIVRETGLAAGLVDFKVCAVDKTWSGLRFARRQQNVDN